MSATPRNKPCDNVCGQSVESETFIIFDQSHKDRQARLCEIEISQISLENLTL